MTGFNNPILGGGGALVYPAIHSPGYPGIPSWSINKNGQAFFSGSVTSGTFNGTNFVMTALGMFYYTGTPGAGNIPVAWMAPATTTVDPFGNTLPASGGVVSYVSGAQLKAGLLGGELRMSGNSGQQDAIISAGGLATYGDLVISSAYGATGGDVPGQFILTSAAYPGGVGTEMIMAPAMPIVAGLPGGTFPAQETWHNMTLANAWANNVSFVAARYRMMPFNAVRIQGVINANAATSPTFFTLPVGYRPSNPSGAAIGGNANVPANVAPQVRWDTSGNLTVGNVTIPSANACFVSCDIPLD